MRWGHRSNHLWNAADTSTPGRAVRIRACDVWLVGSVDGLPAPVALGGGGLRPQ